MKKIFIWRLINFFRVKNFIGSNQAKFDAIPTEAGEIAKLEAAIVEIQIAEDKQETDTTGITKEVEAAKQIMADTMIIYAKKGLPMARLAGKTEFVKILEHKPYFIYRASKATALSRARIMKNTLAGNLTVFSNIKPADIADMDAVILAYDEVKVDTQDAIDEKKEAGTEAIYAGYVKGNAALKNIYDFFYGEYQKNEPELVKKLADCMVVDKTGVHHTGITALFLDGNPPIGSITNLIQNGVIKIMELNKQAVSDINGVASIIKIKPGTYHIEFSKVGYVTKQMIIKIKRGQIVTLEITLVRVSS
ncbi:MAG: hypothetical protein WCI04_04845 [archaeon]